MKATDLINEFEWDDAFTKSIDDTWGQSSVAKTIGFSPRGELTKAFHRAIKLVSPDLAEPAIKAAAKAAAAEADRELKKSKGVGEDASPEEKKKKKKNIDEGFTSTLIRWFVDKGAKFTDDQVKQIEKIHSKYNWNKNQIDKLEAEMRVEYVPGNPHAKIKKHQAEMDRAKQDIKKIAKEAGAPLKENFADGKKKGIDEGPEDDQFHSDVFNFLGKKLNQAEQELQNAPAATPEEQENKEFALKMLEFFKKKMQQKEQKQIIGVPGQGNRI